MKRYAIAALLVLLVTGSACASQATFAWDANADPVTGYRLYQRDDGGEYNTHIWQGTTTQATVETPTDRKTYYVVRAYREDLGGIIMESGNSNEVSIFPPPSTPTNLLIQAIDQVIQGLNTLKEAVRAN